MKKIFIALCAAVSIFSVTAIGQEAKKLGVATVKEHFAQVPESNIDHNYFQKLLNTMDGDIKNLEGEIASADATQKTTLTASLKKKKDVRTALEKKIDSNKELTKTQLLKFADDFLAK